MKKIIFPLICAVLAIAGCEQAEDNSTLLIANGQELVPGALEEALVADRIFQKSEYQKVVNHWEPVGKGDGAPAAYYLFNGDHSLIILGKGDDKGDKSSTDTQLRQSEWALEENGQTLVIEGSPYSVYPDSDYSFFLKAGERMLCFRTISYGGQDHAESERHGRREGLEFQFGMRKRYAVRKRGTAPPESYAGRTCHHPL